VSTGERSCVHYAVNCPVTRSSGYDPCHIWCPHYEWDGKSEKDTA